MLKRGFDVALATVLLVGIAPILLVLAFVVRRKLGSPVLFCQPRIGLNNRTFNLSKFRTMSDERDSTGQLLSDRERLGPFGLLLRRTSLDELPTLWKVRCCHMSLVGPRPLLVQYLPLYSAEQARRHEVRPGITGWAQVHGRNALSWERKFELDVWYVDKQSVLLDIRILFRTVVSVVKRDGINAEGEVTMPVFTGTKAVAFDIQKPQTERDVTNYPTR